MISAAKLTKRFGRFTAVNELSFNVPEGEALALWGSNGAGKTTVIRCLLGLLRYRGTIQVADLDVRRHGKAVRRLIGYVPQELAFHDDLRAIEALHFFARLRKIGRSRPAQVLADVGLSEHGRKRIGELSGGMKQRLALALAMLADPPLLVLDELTSNLDTTAQQSFTDLLRQQKARGKTILFTSHRLEEVEHLADRVIVLEHGRQKTECGPDELADALGLTCRMKLFIEKAQHENAVAALTAEGFEVSRNGVGLVLDVPLRAKAAPLSVLNSASIAVRNFDVTNHDGRNADREVSHV